MRILIQYHERLGDVIRLLPLAKHLHDKGDEVFIECKDQYADILKCVTYARHKKIEDQYDGFDRIFNRQVWPLLYDEYRQSGKWWEDFVFGELAPEAVGERIVFDSIIQGEDLGVFDLVAPFGISQIVRHDPIKVIVKAVKLYGKDDLAVLCPPEFKISGIRNITAGSVSELPWIIGSSRRFLGINSSPSLIASALKEEYDLIPTGNRQDDYLLGANIVSL